MKTKISLLCLCLFRLSFALCQFCPPNLDFESGNFDKWECSIGSTSSQGNKNNITLTTTFPTPGRHEIISGPDVLKDRYGGFPQLCPYGGNYSVRLGNNTPDAEAEGISYTFQMPSTVDTFSFTYFYAVVFEDPKHSTIEQPRFFVKAYDVATGEVINCASYDYIATGGLPGFKVSPVQPSVIYKDWSPVSIQFAGMANKTVRLEFKTADCTQGGHFGYAYVDVGSHCSKLLASAPFCRETNSLLLNAPYGFKSYTWYNADYTAVLGSEQSITLHPAPASDGVFHVDIIPYPGYGCRDTAHAIVAAMPVPDTPIATTNYQYCQFQEPLSLAANAQQGNDLIWYKEDIGGQGTNRPPIPTTLTTGVQHYYVTQKPLFGCESMRKQVMVFVSATPEASIHTEDPEQCQSGNRFRFGAAGNAADISSYTWTLGDGNSETSADSVISYSYKKTGQFNVSLRVANLAGCFSESVRKVQVLPTPIAHFSYPNLLCENDPPLVLEDRSTLNGLTQGIGKWWWNLNGRISTEKLPPASAVSNAGIIAARLAVTSMHGCSSDTFTVDIPVRTRPVAAFTTASNLCDNERILFRDQSTMHGAGPGERPAKWYWQFETEKSNQQNPAVILAAGQQQIRLVTESNEGCRSAGTDTIIFIHPKPTVALELSDSCAQRFIAFRASDRHSAVVKWFWDFGNDFKPGNQTVTRFFPSGGSRPLKLVGETVEGCHDTLARYFTIFENRIVAGKDTTVAKNQPVQLRVEGGKAASYRWSPSAGLDNPTQESPVATFDQDQVYQLESWTAEGCDSRSKVLVKRFSGPELYIPSAFSPNQDGQNDQLKVTAVGIKTFGFLAVYDRWGALVFKTSEVANGWDGTVHGKPADPGIFVAVAQASDYRGALISRKLTVMLTR